MRERKWGSVLVLVFAIDKQTSLQQIRLHFKIYTSLTFTGMLYGCCFKMHKPDVLLHAMRIAPTDRINVIWWWCKQGKTPFPVYSNSPTFFFCSQSFLFARFFSGEAIFALCSRFKNAYFFRFALTNCLFLFTFILTESCLLHWIYSTWTIHIISYEIYYYF